jgi:uncharacterized protein YycO
VSAGTVQVIFSRSRSVQSALLRAFLWSTWSHCAIVDGDNVIEADFGAGVRMRPLADFIAEASAHDLIEIPAVSTEAVTAFARAQLGKPYDWRACIGFIVRRDWHDARRWFCSELIASAFASAGTPLFRLDAARITPRDLFIRSY